jgi:hypothetical protein
MEMIAMLNGLGNAGCRSCGGGSMSIVSGPSFAGLGEVTVSAAYADFSTRIAAATSQKDLGPLATAIDSAKVAGTITLSEASALKVQLMERDEALGPIYKRWWYWPAVAGVALVGYHFYKKSKTGRGLFGVGGGYKIVGSALTGYRAEFTADGTLDYDKAEKECSRINEIARHNRAHKSSSAARGSCVMCGGAHPCTRSH